MITSQIPVTLNLPQGGEPRSKGIHCSSIIRCIASETGILKPEYVESLDLVDLDQAGWWERLSSPVQLKISMGMAWDQYYLPSLGTVTPHPGELEVDGIFMSPDGESLDIIRQGYEGTAEVHGLCVHEVKVTYKSIKTVGDLTTQWLWLAQTKAYCKAMHSLVAFIHVLFPCGDYKYPITPQLLCWRVDYTQEEIDDNWDVLLGYVQHRQFMEDSTL